VGLRDAFAATRTAEGGWNETDPTAAITVLA
jgi:hypothetical protein